jgi:hypothetical protein
MTQLVGGLRDFYENTRGWGWGFCCRTCYDIIAAAATTYSFDWTLVITIVYYLFSWGVLMCFWYTTVEFVNFFVQSWVARTDLFLDYGAGPSRSTIDIARSHCIIHRKQGNSDSNTCSDQCQQWRSGFIHILRMFHLTQVSLKGFEYNLTSLSTPNNHLYNTYINWFSCDPVCVLYFQRELMVVRFQFLD